MTEKSGDSLGFLDSIIRMTGILMINILTLLVFIGVIMRYIFQSYAPWTSEIPLQMMVVMTLLMGGILWKQKKHVTIDFVYERYGPKLRFIFDLVFTLGVLLGGCFWLWGSVLLVLSDLEDKGVSVEMRIPWGYYHFFEVLAFAVFVVYMAAELRKVILKGWKEAE
jgi:TRAP-type C4-dicarboxylate transport system permease small subunit